jgi:hypothetical protein
MKGLKCSEGTKYVKFYTKGNISGKGGRGIECLL